MMLSVTCILWFCYVILLKNNTATSDLSHSLVNPFMPIAPHVTSPHTSKDTIIIISPPHNSPHNPPYNPTTPFPTLPYLPVNISHHPHHPYPYPIAILIPTPHSESAADITRSLELAAYFTHCNLQPAHLMLALKTAMALAFKNKVSGLKAM